MPNYKDLLAQRGLSVRDFATLVGLSNTYVAEVLSGKRQASEETEKKILDALSVCPWCHRKWPHPVK